MTRTVKPSLTNISSGAIVRSDGTRCTAVGSTVGGGSVTDGNTDDCASSAVSSRKVGNSRGSS